MDLYKVLGVCRGATGEELKAAFRKLALQFHPDRHAQTSKQQQELAARRFREAADAYQILSDPQKRAIYDRKGHHPTFSSYGAGDSYSSSSASSSCYNQWHHHRNHYSSPRRWRSEFWTFRINLSPLDVAFHAVFAGTIIVGLVYGAFIGDLMWNRKNSGKSFEDVLRGKQQRIKEPKDDDRIQ